MYKKPRDELRRPNIHPPSRAKHAHFLATHSLAQLAIRGLRGRPEGRGANWGKKRGVGDPLLRVRGLPRVPMTLYCCCGVFMLKKNFFPNFHHFSIIFHCFSCHLRHSQPKFDGISTNMAQFCSGDPGWPSEGAQTHPHHT